MNRTRAGFAAPHQCHEDSRLLPGIGNLEAASNSEHDGPAGPAFAGRLSGQAPDGRRYQR